MSDTRPRLVDAAARVVRERGLAAASARAIATDAGVNQALIFYHFHTVNELIESASDHAVELSIAQYADQLAEVTTLTELLTLGQSLHERERSLGNVALMAQLLAGAQNNEVLARTARHALDAWAAQIDGALRRILRGSPIIDVADVAGLARAVSAAFLGLELYEGADADGAAQAFGALRSLGALVDLLDALGPVLRRALRRHH